MINQAETSNGNFALEVWRYEKHLRHKSQAPGFNNYRHEKQTDKLPHTLAKT